MNISIIIGTLIALVIVCITVTINTIISNNYLSLKKKWNNRARVLCNVMIDVGNLDGIVDRLVKDDSIPENAKIGLLLCKDSLDILLSAIKDYEKEEF